MKGKILQYIGTAALGLAILGGPVNITGRYFYRSYQINNAPVKRDYTPERKRGLAQSTLPTLKIGGFDRNEDGTIDEIIEVGRFGADHAMAYRALPAMPRTAVYTPDDKAFQDKLGKLTSEPNN